MVGKRRQRNLDHTSQKVWKDSEHEYAGQVFFGQIQEPGGFISGTSDLGGKDITGIQETSGNLSGSFPEFCGCKRNLL